MEQERIWDYFQNEGLMHDVFPEARQRFVLRHLESGQAVLDIGVGNGTLERLSLAKGIDIHALDPSERAIQRLRGDMGLEDRAQVGYAQAIPFRDSEFDVVVMSEVLEHLDDTALSSALKEVKRVLKPGGVLLITVPYRENLDANTVVCPDCGKVFHKVGHVQSFDKPRLCAILREEDYEITKLRVTTFVDWRRKGVRNFIKSAIRVALARMGEGIADPRLACLARTPRCL